MFENFSNKKQLSKSEESMPDLHKPIEHNGDDAKSSGMPWSSVRIPNDPNSFVSYDALKTLQNAGISAERANADRPLVDKLLNRNEVGALDILHIQALEEDEQRKLIASYSWRMLKTMIHGNDMVGANEKIIHIVYEEIVKKEEEIKKITSEELATLLHDEWRASRKKEDGTFEPRIKKTIDANWIESHSSDEVDIANTDYSNLPNDWQGENKASAEVATKLALTAWHTPGNKQDEFIEFASAEIHERWLDRNKGWAPPEQSVPYSELSEEEKEKDRIIFKKAREIMGKNFETL